MRVSLIIVFICILIAIVTLSLRYIVIGSSKYYHNNNEHFTGFQSDFRPSCNNNIDLYTSIELITTMPKYVYDSSNSPSNNLDNFFIYSKPAQVDVEEVDTLANNNNNSIKNEIDIHINILNRLVATGKDFPNYVMVFNSQYKMPINFTAQISNYVNRLNMSSVDMLIFGGEHLCYIISKKFAKQILALHTNSQLKPQTLLSLLKDNMSNNNIFIANI